LYATGPGCSGYIFAHSWWLYFIFFIYVRVFWLLYQLWKEYPSSEAKEVFVKYEEELLKTHGIMIMVDPEVENKKKAEERKKKKPTPKRGDKPIPNHTVVFLAAARKEFAQEAYDRMHPKP
jgi:hypothetical protein